MIEYYIQLWQKRTVKSETGCWLFTGANTSKGNGYGRATIATKDVLVHVESYKHFKGPIPEGYEVHHTCFVKNCWNPEHLMATTPQQNVAASASAGRLTNQHKGKTHCSRGHEYTKQNTYVDPRTKGRTCRACRGY